MPLLSCMLHHIILDHVKTTIYFGTYRKIIKWFLSFCIADLMVNTLSYSYIISECQEGLPDKLNNFIHKTILYWELNITHLNGNFNLIKFPSLAALENVKMTTSNANDENFYRNETISISVQIFLVTTYYNS